MNHNQGFARYIFAAMAFFVAAITQAGVEETELKERFGEQQFAPAGGFILQQGQALPDLAWEHPQTGCHSGRATCDTHALVQQTL